MMKAGYKMIVRSTMDLKMAVEPEETTVAAWAEKAREAIDGPIRGTSCEEHAAIVGL
jgi:hypothetical protein